ncbi:hypothetical protein [Pelagovum pacificum]|uniref:Uncharacterized protein n=1 Tax=Pelagovum pacificum TaxID=2588711 RepID=A0A5C5GFQ7_9RHOB|nr:hypothetical protein [Pelagovum pacificum]QQA43965.1 hypothetical protein I8N54_05135 [Pelagovum pacificum]TNY32907.1 hypothetical protein FHY64_06420 [Pelagovum pacificum]
MWDSLKDAAWLDSASAFLLAVSAVLAVLFGYRSARPRGEQPAEPQQLSVAGALIDGQEARKLRASIDANTDALHNNTEAAKGVSVAAERMERSLGDVKDELIRSQYRK